jgi:hypothetical protein
MSTFVSHKRKTRTIKEMMNLFDRNILTSDYLYYHIKETERDAFYNALSKHPTKYLRGHANFSKNQQDILQWLRVIRCKNGNCEEYHKSWLSEFCHHCKLYEKQSTILKYIISDMHDDLECTICISEIENNTMHAKLRCGHSFHIKCIQTWFKQAEKCPCCRANFKNI